MRESMAVLEVAIESAYQDLRATVGLGPEAARIAITEHASEVLSAVQANDELPSPHTERGRAEPTRWRGEDGL